MVGVSEVVGEEGSKRTTSKGSTVEGRKSSCGVKVTWMKEKEAEREDADE